MRRAGMVPVESPLRDYKRVIGLRDLHRRCELVRDQDLGEEREEIMAHRPTRKLDCGIPPSD